MKREDVVKEIEIELDELENIIISTAGVDKDVTDDLMEEYSQKVWFLKSINEDYPFVQSLRIQEICDTLQYKPKISSQEFEEFVIYLQLLGICLHEIRRRRDNDKINR